MAQEVFHHFSTHFGRPAPRKFTLFNSEEIDLGRRGLRHLEDDFTEEEVYAAIQDIAIDKAPDPDGFIGIFSRKVGRLSNPSSKTYMGNT